MALGFIAFAVVFLRNIDQFILGMMSVNKKKFEAYLNINNTNIESIIHDIWISKDESLWSKEPYFYLKLGETADKLGQSMFAHDILKEGFQLFPENIRMAQLYALSLIKCGFIEKARQILSVLVKKGHHDEETLGILGRVYKDMWLMSDAENPKATFLLKSRYLYLHAFKKSRGYYSGINAASLSFIIGDRDLAQKLAKLVLKICIQQTKSADNKNYWIFATLGEAFLLLGKEEESEKHFRHAKKYSTKNYSELASTLRQLKLLSAYLSVNENILHALTIPAIIAFTGHMLDRPGGKKQRFPIGIEGEIKNEIRKKLELLDAGISYSSAACGSDTLFLECMQERNAETNVVLPFHRDDFFQTSIDYAGVEWVQRVERVLDGSSLISYATEGRYAGDDLLFTYANSVIMGKALLRGKLLESRPVLLAVWDGSKNGRKGGTSEFIRLWQSKQLPVEIIDITEIKKRGVVSGEYRAVSGEPSTELKGAPKLPNVKRTFKAMLFADLVGYSKLKEEQYPYFLKYFLGELARNLRRSRFKPIFRNSWGDCIYFVFNDLISAAEYALELRDFVRKTDWQRLHLPLNMSIRIGLHAGPVYYAREPILSRMNYFGSHVTTAARIEPITNPGNVYASEQFAALLIAGNKDSNIDCNYVGIIVLPKEYGKYPIYHIKRKTEIG